MRRASRASHVVARITERRPLIFDTDAPWPHVRAASAVVTLPDGRLAVVQDDAAYLALVGERIVAQPLPIGEGRAVYDSRDGTKVHKPDLEAATLLGHDAEGIARQMVLFGSGSTSRRERVVFIDLHTWSMRVCDLPLLYQALRDALSAPLNIEGILICGDTVRLLQRGNGAMGVDAVMSMPLLWLQDPSPTAPPPVDVVRWDLGALGGAPLSFTDGYTNINRHRDSFVFIAAAEDSPDTFDDGTVMGSAIGEIGPEDAWWTPILDESGEIATLKAEGLAPRSDGAWFVTTDPDDPDLPSQLLTVQLQNNG